MGGAGPGPAAAGGAGSIPAEPVADRPLVLHGISTTRAGHLDIESVPWGDVRRIAVIEDDHTIAAAVADRLRTEGFEVETSSDGTVGLARCLANIPDLVVLDLRLPGLDGIEVCRRLRAVSSLPIVMLTARDDEADQLVGLAVGADDYLTKPFSPRVLVARIHALLRRVDGHPTSDARTLTVGPLRIDPSSRRVHLDDVEVHLTPTEFDLAHHLASRPGTVLSRDRLLAEVWGYNDSAGARTVDSHVRALRRKLGERRIRTVHGIGYAFEPVE